MAAKPTKRTDRHSQRGFTLIELMVTMAIIGILAGVGVPMYLTHLHQSQYVEVAQGAKLAKSSLESCVYFNNSLDACDNTSELASHGYKDNFATNSQMIDSIDIIRIGSDIAARVTPATNVPGASFLTAADTYILRANIATRGTDLYIESWSVDPTSGCVPKQYC